MSDIAINPVTRRVQFTGNTGTGPYAFNFNVLQSSDIVVYKNNVLLTETTDYTVSIAANGTGNITMVVALVLTDILTIIGGRELSRTTDFVTAGDLLASSLNEQLDSNVIMSQQLDERFGRTLAVPPGDEDKTLDLPLAADRADKIILFDESGNVTAAAPSDFFGNAVLGGNFIVNTATGDGSQTAFGLTVAPGIKTNIQIHIDGVYQNKSTFSLSGSTVTFTEAPPLNAAIEFMVGESVTQITGDASAITYNQGGTGAQDRTLTSKLQDTVSVKDFGAVGDGVADDTAAIQAAIDYSVNEGRSLYVPEGTYIISSIVYEQTNGARLNIFGAGRTSSVFKGSAALTNTAMFWFGNNSGHAVYGLFMRDIGLDGSLTTNCTGIVATECGLSHFSNMRIFNWGEGANCDGSIHMIWDGHNEVFSCRYGIRFRRIPVGVPSGPFDKSVTQHPIALSTNISKIENTWFSGSAMEQAIVMEGGLVSVENCVFQSVGNSSLSSVVLFKECNEAYDYGGGPRFVNNWIEGGTYKYWVEVKTSRNAVLKDNFYSGSGSTCEGAFLLRDGAENCIISENSFRGAATAAATEGRQRSSAAVYLDVSDPTSFAFTIRDNYLTKNTLNYVIDNVSMLGTNSWRYSVFSDMNGTPPAVYDSTGTLAYMPDKTVHAAGCVSYSGGTPTIEYGSNIYLIVDSGAGYLTIQYSRSKAFNNQPFVASAAENSSGTPFFVSTMRSNTIVDRVRVYDTSGVATDPDSISFVCYGGTL